jgi:hypothetical protein
MDTGLYLGPAPRKKEIFVRCTENDIRGGASASDCSQKYKTQAIGKKGNNTLVKIFGVKNNIMEGLETGRRKTALTERRCENNESSRAW